MKIHLATDHAGFLHKEALRAHLNSLGHVVVDHGAFEQVDGDDYPDFISHAAQAVAEDTESMGIIFGYSGQGEAMVANRYKGVRCGVYCGENRDILELMRQHNNANMISFGAHFVNIDDMIECVTIWLSTQFSNDERHIRRLNKF